MKHIIDVQNNKLVEAETTSEDIAKAKAEDEVVANELAQEKADKEANDNLKASAKAKLMAGEPMTEEEANLTLHINNEQS